MPDRHMRVPSSDQVAEDKNKSGMWWLGRKAPHSGGPSSQLDVNVEKKSVFQACWAIRNGGSGGVGLVHSGCQTSSKTC